MTVYPFLSKSELTSASIVPGFMHGEIMDQEEHGQAEIRKFFIV